MLNNTFFLLNLAYKPVRTVRGYILPHFCVGFDILHAIIAYHTNKSDNQLVKQSIKTIGGTVATFFNNVFIKFSQVKCAD